MNLREHFEKSDLCKYMVGTGTDANWNLKRHPDGVEHYSGQYLWSRLESAWQGFQSGHAAGLQDQSHSANTVGGPTPVMDAAPAWQSMDTAPTDGREFLIRYPLQGNVKQLACWNNIHKYWQSKGEPITPMQQKCEWYPLP